MAIYQSEPLKKVSDAVGGALIAAKYTKIGCAVIKGTKIAAHAATMIKGSYVIGNVIRNNIERASMVRNSILHSLLLICNCSIII